MKCALFVDFDNVYSGLRRLDPAYAERFAVQPAHWLRWLTETLPLPPHCDPQSQRRILVRRCYLNPQVYQQYRFAFSRSGFEITDCPPMTAAGKTSTDIHMVLDIVDVLQHSTHFDEFIVFSADADFSPVLRKLRRSDRRTTVLAAGATSAAYDASADLLIDPDEFIREALGFGDDEGQRDAPAARVAAARLVASAAAVSAASSAGRTVADPSAAPVSVPALPGAAPLANAAPAQAQGMMFQAERRVRDIVDAAHAPVPLAELAQTVAARIPGLLATDWAGAGSFAALLQRLNLAPLQIDPATDCLLDPRRLHADAASASAVSAASDMADAPHAPEPPTATSGALHAAAQIVLTELARATRPVPCATLAHQVSQRVAGLRAEWNGLGSFRRFVETLDLPGLAFDWSSHGGMAYDPARHTLDSTDDSADDEAWRDNEVLWAQVAPVFSVANLPPMSPRKYAAALDSLAGALAQAEFNLIETGKQVRDLCADAGVPVSRREVNQLLRSLLYGGFDPLAGHASRAALTAAICNVGLAACARERMAVDDGLRAALLQWVGGAATELADPAANPAEN